MGTCEMCFPLGVAAIEFRKPLECLNRKMAYNNTSRIIQGARQVKPILSLDKDESRRRVLGLYKAWHRQIPYIMLNYDLPVTKQQYKEKLKEKFAKNKHVTDLRAIDMLVIKGQQGLVEIIQIWSQKTHVSRWFNDTHNPRPTDFMSKFYDGHDQ